MDRFAFFVPQSPWAVAAASSLATLLFYLVLVNNRMRGVPDSMKTLKQKPWTVDMLKETYARLAASPCHVADVKDQLPRRLERRYVVTGGNGLVGGYLVLELLARGQSPESIRIADFQAMHRRDMLDSPARDVDVVHTDIASVASVDAAFAKAWPASVAQLPLTVFHTAAIMVPSDRSQAAYDFLERVNVNGTRNVLAAARRAGADVVIATASASIPVRIVGFWMAPWRLLTAQWPRNFVQRLDEADFSRPLRTLSGFYSAYAASKATAERVVCDANCERLRTGTIRPASGIYGDPTDNTVGAPLNQGLLPSWSFNIVNSFVHGMNCAVAHLHLEAVLADPHSSTRPQAGRPFTVTDPNAPIQFQDLWRALETLSATPFRVLPLVPVQMLLLSYAVEWYMVLSTRAPLLRHMLPRLTGDVKLLLPPLFSIVTHVYATNDPISRPVKEGGLGYRGLITTLDGVVQEVLDWNLEHRGLDKSEWTKYKSSVSMADELGKGGK